MADPGNNLKCLACRTFQWMEIQMKRQKYIRKKTTEMWRFKKLSSKDSAEYRKKESERVRAYQKKKKLEKEKQTTDESQSQSDTERSKMLSRDR